MWFGGRRAATSTRWRRRVRLIRDVVWVTYMHHPVYRASNHVFKNGSWTDWSMVPVIIRVAFYPEIPVLASLIAIHGSHIYFLDARFRGPVLGLTCLTVVSFGMTEINLWIVWI